MIDVGNVGKKQTKTWKLLSISNGYKKSYILTTLPTLNILIGKIMIFLKYNAIIKMHLGFRESEFQTNYFNLRSDTYYDDKDLTKVRGKQPRIAKISKISLGMSNDKPKRVIKSSSKSLKTKSKKAKK